MKSLTKRCAHMMLAASVMFSSIPHAFGQAAPNAALMAATQVRTDRTLGRLLSQPSVRLALTTIDTEGLKEKFEKAAKEKPREAAVGVGQTLIVMMVLAGMEMTAQQIQKNGGHRPTSAQLAAIISGVASATVNSPQIWTSITSSSGFSLAQKPALALSQVFLSPKLRAAFAPLLARAITSTIAFVGWDFGAQLWTEASLLLKSPEDFKIASGTFGMSKGLLTTAFATKAQSNSALDQQRARVAKEMMRNMLLVLSVSNLRSELVYNFLRTDLMTGEFQTMLASFIACGAIGTAIFPGAGTLVGLIFGAVGIVGAQFVPQSAKDRITNGWQSLRATTLRFEMNENLKSIRFDTSATSLANGKSVASLSGDLETRRNLRSRFITIEWEQMFLEARANENLAKTFPEHFSKMKQFYVSELAEIRSLEQILSKVVVDQDLTNLIHREWLKELHREEVRAQSMIEFFDALAAAASVDPRNDEIIKSIEAAESRGFNESNTVLAWLQSAG